MLAVSCCSRALQHASKNISVLTPNWQTILVLLDYIKLGGDVQITLKQVPWSLSRKYSQTLFLLLRHHQCRAQRISCHYTITRPSKSLSHTTCMDHSRRLSTRICLQPHSTRPHIIHYPRMQDHLHPLTLFDASLVVLSTAAL